MLLYQSISTALHTVTVWIHNFTSSWCEGGCRCWRQGEDAGEEHARDTARREVSGAN